MKRFLNRLVWYKNRLAAMSLSEIVYRLRESMRRHYDRRYGWKMIAPLRDYGALPRLPGLREGLDAWLIPDILLNQWKEDAHNAQKGTLSFFGHPWPPCPRENVWHMDPLSKNIWPKDVFCFAIDYRHTSGNGDIKYVWELNRLQYLQPVAALARKTQDTTLAQFCLNEIESWIDNNPPFLGVHWSSGIELTLRMMSILTVTTFVGDALSRQARSKIWSSLHTHARWIERYPSRYSSANNHRTAEGLGLFLIGCLCPHFHESARWKETGWHILCEAAQNQILPDGTGAEQAVAYAASVLETLLTGYKIALESFVSIPEFFIHKVTLGGEYLRWLCDAHGGYPHIGDDDDACVFGRHHAGDHYATNILACIASLVGRADLTPPVTQPHLRQAFFGFPPASDFTPYGARCFPNGGMTIGRHNSPQGDILLVFDHGSLGYLSIAAHGHADALAIWLHKGGQPLFVDAGTYLYHAHTRDRHYFRSTAAHNTLLLENTDSSQMAGHFNWSHKAQTTLHKFTSHGDFWQVEAEHDGYLKTFQTIHRRHLHVSCSSGAVIEDMLIGPVAQLVDISFLIHPCLTARHEGQEILVLDGEKLLLRIRHESDLVSSIGAPHTHQGGWYSPMFGIKQATTRLSFKGRLFPNQKAVTRLYWSS